MKKRLKKLRQHSPYLPLALFLLTCLYGLFKMDPNDFERDRYGWFYILFLILPVTFAYLTFYIFLLKDLIRDRRSKKHQSPYHLSLFILTIISLLVGIAHPLNVLMPLFFANPPLLTAFAISLLLIAILGYLKKKEPSQKKHNVTPKKSSLTILALSLCLVMIPPALIISQSHRTEINDKKDYTDRLTEAYKKNNQDYHVTVTEVIHSDYETIVYYVIEENDVHFQEVAKFETKKKGSTNKLIASTFISPTTSFNRTAVIQAESPRGKDILNDYLTTVDRIIKEEKLDLAITEDDPTSEEESSMSYYSVTNNQWENLVTPELTTIINGGQQSSNKDKQAFQGWGALTADDLIHHHILIPSITLGPLNNQMLSDDELAEAYQIIQKKLNQKKLPDGLYSLDFPNQSHIFSLEKGQYQQEEQDIYTYQLNYSSSHDYQDWPTDH